jgi:hypothetical protein
MQSPPSLTTLINRLLSHMHGKLNEHNKPAEEQDKAASEQAQSVDSAKAAKTRAKAWAEQDGQALQSIALSPEVEIITVAQPATSEKSLTDFALAMGLDPSASSSFAG